MNSINLKPELDELNRLNEFILTELPHEDLMVNLIVEETFVNIINYSGTDYIIVNLDYKEPNLTIEFVDNGMEFNPILKEEYVSPDSIDEARIGGLGIHLTKEIADEMDYHYIDGENHLRIVKKVE